jgi:hypothetical protein
MGLSTNEQYLKTVKWAKSTATHISLHGGHVSFDQLATSRRDTARSKTTAHRFEKHDARRKCAKLTKKMALTKQIFTLLVTQNVPRLQQLLLALCFRQGWGMQGILENWCGSTGAFQSCAVQQNRCGCGQAT